LDNEQSTLNLVRDVADVLDNIAANPLHTPALYSGFLRALISAKLEPNSLVGAEDGKSPSAEGDQQQQQQQYQQQQSNIDGQSQLNGNSNLGMSTSGGYGNQYQGEPAFNLMNEFQFESEMGPVADMSTFPPTMAPNPNEGDMGVLTMENILSSGFWDSMLVPGASPFC
jgi:hypothetical protein